MSQKKTRRRSIPATEQGLKQINKAAASKYGLTKDSQYEQISDDLEYQKKERVSKVTIKRFLKTGISDYSEQIVEILGLDSEEVLDYGDSNTSSIDTQLEPLSKKRRLIKEQADQILELKAKKYENLDAITESRKIIEILQQDINELKVEIKQDLITRPPIVPKQRFNEFIGRKEKINEIIDTLENQNTPVVVIDGLGGMGKTAITHEIINQITANEASSFYLPIWKSSKPEEFSQEKSLNAHSTQINSDNLLVEIGNKIGYRSEIEALKNTEDKIKSLSEKLNEERYLLVIDNLETFAEYQAIIASLDKLLMNNSSKAIITSRRVVSNHSYVRAFRLEGLQKAESLELLRKKASEESRAKDVIEPLFLEERHEILSALHQKVGGLPLAIELIVGLLAKGNNLDTVLAKLQQVNFQQIDSNTASDQDVYQKFYKFIYQDAWDQLSENAQYLIVDIGIFDLIAGARISDLMSLEMDLGWTAQKIEVAAKELIQSSLIKKSGVEEKQTFFLHSLTYQFVQQEILAN